MENAEISLVDLPVGFRFRPTEEELVNHYLKLKILGNKMVELIIPEVDVHQLSPWDLASEINELSSINSDGDEWFFFCRLQNKYPQSKRTRRSNDYGLWKKTGGTRKIRTRDKKNILGLKKILVFKESGSPKNVQTKWVLHEYHLNADLMGNVLTDRSDFVLNHLKKNPDKKVKKTLCKIFPHLRQCNTPNNDNEVADNQEALDVQPEMSPGGLKDSLSPFQALDDDLLYYGNTPTYQSQEGAEEEWLSFLNFSDNNNGE